MNGKEAPHAVDSIKKTSVELGVPRVPVVYYLNLR